MCEYAHLMERKAQRLHHAMSSDNVHGAGRKREGSFTRLKWYEVYQCKKGYALLPYLK